MEAGSLWRILGIATGILVVVIIVIIVVFTPLCQPHMAGFCLLFGGYGSVPSGKGLEVAEILGLVGLAAVGIERFIEGIWSVVDVCKGSFWPLNVVAKQIDGQIKALNQPLEPFFNQLSKDVAAGNAAAGTLTTQKLQEVQKELTDGLTELKNVATRNGSAQPIFSIVDQKLRGLQKDYNVDKSSIDTLLKSIQDGANDVDTFVQSFKDNPGRRLVSLYIGTVMGLVVAGFFKLDLLATVLKTDQTHSVALGIIIAGVVMGLGSSPAHEIVQAILNWRKSLTTNKQS